MPKSRQDAERIFDTVHQLWRCYELNCDPIIRDSGLTRPQYQVLAALGESPQGLNFRQISETNRVTKGNITGIVRRLESGGLITRKTDTEDRRAFIARLTPKGRRLYQRLEPRIDGCRESLLKDLTVAERRTLLRLLEKSNGKDQR